MKQLLIAALLLAAPGAWALDCVMPQPAQSFKDAEASLTEVVVVMGRFEFDASLLVGDIGQEGVVFPPIPGRFVGHGLTQGGFDAAMDIPVDIQQVCAGTWCGQSAFFSDTTIAFLDVVDGIYTLPVEPCGTGVYRGDPETVALLTACMRAGSCEPNPQQ